MTEKRRESKPPEIAESRTRAATCGLSKAEIIVLAMNPILLFKS
jgi:hypothetical protein